MFGKTKMSKRPRDVGDDDQDDDKDALPTRRLYAIEVHRRAVRPKVRRKVLSTTLFETLTADHRGPFGDGKKNGGKRYYLAVCDVFSRYGWAIATTEPTAASTWRDFKTVLADIKKRTGITPKFLWTDEGLFAAQGFKTPLEAAGITLYHAGEHAVLAERLIQTYSNNIAREETAEDTTEWTRLLPDVVERYNHRKHAALNGLTPLEAIEQTASETKALHEKQYGAYLRAPLQPPDPALKLGQWVRMSTLKRQYEKGSTATWSEELMKIVAINTQFNPPTYTLEDAEGNILPGGNWYREQLQPSAFTPETQTALLRPTKEAGPDEAEEVVEWRHDPKDKGRFPFSVRVRYGKGDVSEWLPIRLYIGKQDKSGAFVATTRAPNQVLEPVRSFVKTEPTLRKEVWLKLD